MSYRILITGGAGTLGKAIIQEARNLNLDAEFTVYSRDPLKQHILKKKFPDVRFVTGDILDGDMLRAAMVGHNYVIHAAAIKHIPECETYPSNAYQVNVVGSQTVAQAAIDAGIERVMGISTDKVCYPLNAYGCTKKMMEHLFHDYAISGYDTSFQLVRYGNVLGSNGSVIQVWKQMIEANQKITATHPDMTRFWLTERQAAEFVLTALTFSPNNICVVPRLPALRMADMHEYLFPDTPIEYLGVRPGEKYHECMLTAEETVFAMHAPRDLYKFPCENISSTIDPPVNNMSEGYSSDKPDAWLTKAELERMVSGAI